MTIHRLRSDIAAAAAVVTLLALSACSESTRIDSASPGPDSTAATLDSVPDTTADTVLETTTTALPTTTTEPPAPPTVPPTLPPPPPPPPPPASVEPVLRGTGIGSALFGTSDESVLAYLTPLFGGVATDVPSSFPTDRGDDYWTTADGELGFIAPISRTVCFVNHVCLYFGGTAAADLSFTGWVVADPGTPSVHTIEGIELGDLWSEHTAAVTRISGGCYSSGIGGTADGLDVGLVSSGEFFNAYDSGTGTWADRDPDPADVTIHLLLSGRLIDNLWADC